MNPDPKDHIFVKIQVWISPHAVPLTCHTRRQNRIAPQSIPQKPGTILQQVWHDKEPPGSQASILHSFSGNYDVSIWMKYIQVGHKTILWSINFTVEKRAIIIWTKFVCLLSRCTKKIFKETRGPQAPEYHTFYTDFFSVGLIFAYLQAHGGHWRTMWNSNINSPLIPWSVNPFLQFKSSIFGNVHLKWYISRSFKGLRRFMLWPLTKNRSIPRPYNSDFLLTTTCFIPSWIMMNEMCVSSHNGKS